MGLVRPEAATKVFCATWAVAWAWVLAYCACTPWLMWIATPVLMVAAALATAHGLRHRRAAFALMLLASPAVVLPVHYALSAVDDYRDEKAVIRVERLSLEDPYAELDPSTRLSVRPLVRGCIGLAEHQVLEMKVQNATTRGLVWLFGTPRNLYAGPLPTLEEWREELAAYDQRDALPVTDPPTVLARRAYNSEGLEARQMCQRHGDGQAWCQIEVVDLLPYRPRVIGGFQHALEPSDGYELR